MCKMIILGLQSSTFCSKYDLIHDTFWVLVGLQTSQAQQVDKKQLVGYKNAQVVKFSSNSKKVGIGPKIRILRGPMLISYKWLLYFNLKFLSSISACRI